MRVRYQVKPDGGNYAVIDATTGKVVTIRNARAYALAAAEKLERKARQKIRPCITCGLAFRSTGPGNRMCMPCRRDVSEGLDTLGIAP